MRDESDPTPLGREEGFASFYLKEYPSVVAIAFALTGNRWAAEDIAQEAFLVVHRNWDKVIRYEHPGLWARRVASNIAVSVFRRRLVEIRTIGRLSADEPSIAADLWEEDADFWGAVRSLPRRQAQVVALYYLEDRTIADVSEILHMATGTVKKHLHDGRRALARRLRLEEETE